MYFTKILHLTCTMISSEIMKEYLHGLLLFGTSGFGLSGSISFSFDLGTNGDPKPMGMTSSSSMPWYGGVSLDLLCKVLPLLCLDL